MAITAGIVSWVPILLVIGLPLPSEGAEQVPAAREDRRRVARVQLLHAAADAAHARRERLISSERGSGGRSFIAPPGKIAPPSGDGDETRHVYGWGSETSACWNVENGLHALASESWGMSRCFVS